MARLRRLYAGVVLLIVAALSSFSVAAQETEEAGDMLQNPVITENFPDPFILKVSEDYFAYSTNSSSRNVPMARSTDLVHWELVRDVMSSLASWVSLNESNVWAPEVLVVGEQYVLYYTAHDRASNRQCIGVAVSDSPDGPFSDSGDAPFICQAEVGGSIDASPFRDEDGTLYLYWKNDGNCCLLATYLYVQELSPDGLVLVGEPVQLVRNDKPWEGSVVEAPTMWLHEGSYYLFYSGNSYGGAEYAIGYALCESVVGPCEDAEENPILASDMESQPLVMGPGHPTLLTDEAGETWLVYHVWQISSSGTRTDTRQVWMDRLVWEDGRPVVQGPTRDPQPAPVTTEP